MFVYALLLFICFCFLFKNSECTAASLRWRGYKHWCKTVFHQCRSKVENRVTFSFNSAITNAVRFVLTRAGYYVFFCVSNILKSLWINLCGNCSQFSVLRWCLWCLFLASLRYLQAQEEGRCCGSKITKCCWFGQLFTRNPTTERVCVSSEMTQDL